MTCPVRRPVRRPVRSALQLLAVAGFALPLLAGASDPAPHGKAAAAVKPAKLAPEDPAPAVAAPALDPMEQLRQRLAGRLTGGKVAETGNLHELRVVTQPMPDRKSVV